MKKIESLILIMLLTLSINAQKTLDISGLIVDKNGIPVSNARISWRYEPSETVIGGSTFASVLSMNDGHFGVAVKWHSNKTIRVFLEAPTANDCAFPIDITSTNAQNYIEFPSIVISDYKPEIFLGKVDKIIEYGIAEIKFDETNVSLMKEIENRLIYLVINNDSGQILSRKTVRSALIDRKNGLRFCLPTGNWNLSLFRAGGESVDLNNNRVKIEPNKTTSICIL